jgi:hypothetical protein
MEAKGYGERRHVTSAVTFGGPSTWRKGALVPRAYRVLLGSVLLLGSLSGCGSDTTGPAASAGPLYWQLQLNHHAVTLATVAPYDTIHLTATPLDPTGASIPTTANPVYTVLNQDTSLTIDSTGFVQVHWTGETHQNVVVVARLRVGGAVGATLTDTVMFNIVHLTGSAPQFDTLLFQPIAGDSARRAVVDRAGNVGSQTFDAPAVQTPDGSAIADALVHYRSSDPLVASFASTTTTGTPMVNAISPGVVLLTAEATVFGKRRVDSLRYTVGYPLQVLCFYGLGQFRVVRGKPIPDSTNTLSLGTITVGQGGAVMWGNGVAVTTDDSLDVQFDDTTGIEGLPALTTFKGRVLNINIPPGLGGNIPAFPAAPVGNYIIYKTVLYDSTTSKARLFTQPGTYHWVSRHQEIAGIVRVVANDSLQKP